MNSDKDNPKISIAVEQINIDTTLFGQEPDLNSLLILPTKNMVLFPNVTISVSLTRPISEEVANMAYESRMPVGVVCQTNPDIEWPTLTKGLYKVGVLADVIKVLELPGGERTAIVRARDPFRIIGSGKNGKRTSMIMAKVKMLEDYVNVYEEANLKVIVRNIRKMVNRIVPGFPEGLAQMMQTMMTEQEPEVLVNIVATNMPLEPDEKIAMLTKRDMKTRAMMLLRALSYKAQELELNMDIMNKVKQDLDEDQRRNILQRQMETIHEELYGSAEDEPALLEARAMNVNLSEQAREVFNRELSKLKRINPQSPDYFVIFQYLDTLLSLPWDYKTEQNRDLPSAQETLEQEHCGLDKVKERILEQIAVVMHNPEGKSPILCLVGPPGVGKTSLGQSVAAALNRPYQRVSLGGLHDEAEIRGHRRTYIGAMPGRIIDALKRAQSNNPVLVLDEVDKIGADYKGDPSSALLEVLDPEQNCHFHDNYIDVDFDLSNVLFMATANTLATVPKPLLDRMEIITLSGYLTEEKLEIANKHLLRRIAEEYAIAPGDFNISDQAIEKIINEYTSESGVRQLEKSLASLARKFLLAKLSNKEFPNPIQPENLKDLLGLPPFIKEKWETNDFAGVVTGLAWTEVGGEILLAEASLESGKHDPVLTGNLGQVMKESASIAYQWVRSHAQQLGIKPELFDKYTLHVHFPEGAIPKDGPSAGITIATAIVSAFKQKRVRERLAMTGEMTLRGKVLPVGGIKEKILAAKRAGITDIALSADNRKDIQDVDPKYIQGLTFHYFDSALDVMRFAITDEDVVDPLDFGI